MGGIISDAELTKELLPYREYVAGNILNAGCGKRDVDLGSNSIRLDINPNFATSVDVQADVHKLPFADKTFNTVVSIAVLEHTEYPWEVAKEFFRVLKPNGKAIVTIPFFQPLHGSPYDFARFTRHGIQALMEWASFSVIRVDSVHPLGFNVEWIIRELIQGYPGSRRLTYPIRRWILPRIRSSMLRRHVDGLQSAFCVVAERPE